MAYTFEHNAGTDINEGDPWRPVNVFVHAPGQIGQIVKCTIYDAGSWCEDVYYHYDALGNVMGYSNSSAGFVAYEMDAFGNRIENSNSWESMTSIGPKEHLTGKMLDDDTGLYYFHARWYDPQVGRFIGRDPSGYDTEYLNCSSNPISCVDATGLWGFDVHFAYTMDTAREIFGLGHVRDAYAIADWNQATDEMFWTFPLGWGNYREYHYDLNAAMGRIESSYRTCDERLFGIGLHGAQDNCTHGRLNDDGEPMFPPPWGHLFAGDWPDKWEGEPRNDKAKRETEERTETLLVEWKCRCIH